MTTIAAMAIAVVSSPSARLLEPGLLAQADEPPPSLELPPMNPEATPEALRDEIRRLEALKPSLGLPITLLAVGGAVSLNGLGVMLLGVVGPPLFIFGVVVVALGMPLIAIGAVMLVNRIAERRQYNEEIELRQTQLRQLGPRQPLPPASPFPPPQVRGPEAPLRLAVF